MAPSREKPPIAVLTDFGYRDHYAGVMKGVIANLAPAARVIDLTHGIPPQSVIAGAIALAQSWRYFPGRTVFLVVVDPGVGTARLPIAIETRSGARFVGPDNGVLWLAAQAAGIRQMVELREARYRLDAVSSTFHGRDVFAPAAAHIFNGAALASMGPRLERIEQVSIARPEDRERTLVGRVIYVDGFGNLVTNLSREAIRQFAARFPARTLLTRIRRGAAMKILKAYGDAPRGAALATFGSFELLEVAIRDGNAAAFFRAGEGTPVTVGYSA